MDAEHEARAKARIELDLLKASSADTLHRKVAPQDRPDRPWQTLTNALRHALSEHARNHAAAEEASVSANSGLLRPESVTEAEVRRRLLMAYMQPPCGVEAIMKAKLEDSLSFFNLAKYSSVQKVKEHWNWYLNCLTFEENCFNTMTEIINKPGVLDIMAHRYDIPPEHRQEFSSTFRITLQVCLMDKDGRGHSVEPPPNALLIEAFPIQGAKCSSLQLALGDGEHRGCLVAKAQTKSGYGPSGHKESFSMQQWLHSPPLGPGQWHDVILEKGLRHVSLSVDGEESDRWSSEDLDPFYSELMTSDMVVLGGSRDGTATNPLVRIAAVVVNVGEESQEADRPPKDKVRMPLDKVDLQTVAGAFQAQITVTHLKEEAWRFLPPGRTGKDVAGCCAHLLRHGHLWAAMLGPRAPEDEPRSLAGAVVELGEMPGLLCPASHRTAVILDHKRDLNAYMACVFQEQVNNAAMVPLQIPLERNQIKSIVYQEDFKGVALDDDDDESEGPELLRMIPSGCLWFFLLQEFVRRVAADRLHLDHMQLKGVDLARETTPRCGGNPPLPQAANAQSTEGSSQESRSSGEVDRGEQGFRPAGAAEVPKTRRTGSASASAVSTNISSSQQPSSASASNVSSSISGSLGPSDAATSQAQNSRRGKRLRLAEVQERLRLGDSLAILATCDWDPLANAGQLQIKALNQVYIKECREHWMLCHLHKKEACQAWCPAICLIVWTVRTAYEPEPTWDLSLQKLCLRLEVGQAVLVTRRFEGDWHGWAAGRLHESEKDATIEQIFPLIHVEPEVLLA